MKGHTSLSPEEKKRVAELRDFGNTDVIKYPEDGEIPF